MTIVFGVEPWETYYRDCQELWREHYEEIAVDKDRMAPLPDVARFEAIDRIGQLFILTARRDGKMIGYVVAVVLPHPHFAETLVAVEDMYFLTKRERKGKGLSISAQVGARMIDRTISDLKSLGVKKVFFHTKKHRNNGAVLSALGFSPSDEIYSKWIGD